MSIKADRPADTRIRPLSVRPKESSSVQLAERPSGVLLMNWQWALDQRIAGTFMGTEPEAVELIENFYGLLHSLTFVAASADMNW